MTERNTADLAKALKLRARMKRKKPNFVRPESWRYVRLKENWRKPKGLDHKVRLKYKGWPPGVNVGYRGPKSARGLHPSGYREVLVHNIEELREIDPKTQAIRIAHTVGKRKRTRILVEAKKRKILILNLREATRTRPEEKELAEETVEKEELEKEEAETEEVAKPEKPKRKEKAKKTKKKAEKQ